MSPRLPKYRLHKPTGQGVTTVRGKDYYFGKFEEETSERKYHRLIAEYLISDHSPTFGVKATEYTMAGLAMAYLSHAKNRYSTGNEFANIKLALGPVDALYADLPVNEFGPKQYRACRDWWVRKAVSRQYINKQSKRLIAILKWGVGEGLVPVEIYQTVKCVDPLRSGRTSAKEALPIRPVDDSVVDATLPHLPPVVADMIRFQRLSGCRPGEVCKITPAMVDRSNDVWEIRLVAHKNAWRGKQRTIYVGPKAQEVLRPYLLRGADAACFSPIEATKQRRQTKHAARVTPLSCGNRPGTKHTENPQRTPSEFYCTQSFYNAIRYACRKAFPAPKELNKADAAKWNREHCWAPNQLRHSAGTAIRKEFGLEGSQVILGHSEITTTQIYAEADRARAIEIVGRVG